MRIRGCHRALVQIALIAMATAGWAKPAAAQNTITHLNVPAGRIINLTMRKSASLPGQCSQVSGTPYDLVRVRANGVRDDQAFVVPAGKIFVVTDITWTARPRSGSSFTPNQALSVAMTAFPAADPNTRQPVFGLRKLAIPAGFENGLLSDSMHLVSGVRIAPEHSICLGVSRVTPNLFSVQWFSELYLQGYTVAAP